MTNVAPVLQIVHLEDQVHDVELVRGWLEDAHLNCEVLHVQTRSEFQEALQKPVHLIISDYQLPSFNGLQALQIARKTLPDVPFILFSGTIGEEVAIESLKLGAVDYILKQRPHRLVSAVQQGLENARVRAERKRAEAKLREQAALLDKAQDAIFVCDLHDRITYWNSSARRIYGWTAEEAIGSSADRLLSTSNQATLRSAVQQLNQRGEWFGELNQARRDGTTVVVESRWTLLHDAADQPNAKLVINTDVTERKQLEAQFLRSQRMGCLGALAGGIAHDLSNLLTPVLLGVELLEHETLKPESRELLATMGTCAKRGSQMVKQILSFARGVGGAPLELDVKPLVKEMAQFATETFPQTIQVQVNLPTTLPPIVGNSTQIHQILLNLCVNARDAMPNGGTLELSARALTLKDHAVREAPGQTVSGPYLVLSVSDTGHGMTAEVLQRVFEPFFTTKREGSGTGLGLSTVFGIAKSHNGFVEVSSQLNKGTCFEVYLPAASQGNGQRPELS